MTELDLETIRQRIDTLQGTRRSEAPAFLAVADIDDRISIESYGLRSAHAGQQSFKIGCIVHSMLSVAALELSRRGCLSLATPVARFVEQFAGTKFGDEVHLGHLLCHSTGYASLPQGAHPGRRWSSPGAFLTYAPRDAFILEAALADAMDAPTRVILEETVLNGLYRAIDAPFVSMNRSTSVFEDFQLPLSVLVEFCKTYLYRRTNAPPAQREIIERIVDPVCSLPQPIGPETLTHVPLAYGHGCGIFSNGLLGVLGYEAASCCAVLCAPDLHRSFALMVESTDIPSRNRLADEIAGIIEMTGDISQIETKRSFTDLDQIIGVYRQEFDSSMGVEIKREGGAIQCLLHKAQRILRPLTVLVAADNHTWTPGADAFRMPIRFLGEGNDRCVGIMLGSQPYWRTD